MAETQPLFLTNSKEGDVGFLLSAMNTSRRPDTTLELISGSNVILKRIGFLQPESCAPACRKADARRVSARRNALGRWGMASVSEVQSSKASLLTLDVGPWTLNLSPLASGIAHP